MHPLVVTLTVLALIPAATNSRAPAKAASADEVIALEKDSWRAWQDKDVAFWQRHLSPDHIELDGPGGPGTKDSVISAIASRKCGVASYDLQDFTVRELDRDTVLLVYKAAQEFVCPSGKIPAIGWITSLYKRRGGRWENVLFEHLPVKAPQSAILIRPLNERVVRNGN